MDRSDSANDRLRMFGKNSRFGAWATEHPLRYALVAFVVVALPWGVVGMGPEWMLHHPLRALIGSVVVGGTFGVIAGLGARWSKDRPADRRGPGRVTPSSNGRGVKNDTDEAD